MVRAPSAGSRYFEVNQRVRPPVSVGPEHPPERHTKPATPLQEREPRPRLGGHRDG